MELQIQTQVQSKSPFKLSELEMQTCSDNDSGVRVRKRMVELANCGVTVHLHLTRGWSNSVMCSFVVLWKIRFKISLCVNNYLSQFMCPEYGDKAENRNATNVPFKPIDRQKETGLTRIGSLWKEVKACSNVFTETRYTCLLLNRFQEVSLTTKCIILNILQKLIHSLKKTKTNKKINIVAYYSATQ